MEYAKPVEGQDVFGPVIFGVHSIGNQKDRSQGTELRNPHSAMPSPFIVNLSNRNATERNYCLGEEFVS